MKTRKILVAALSMALMFLPSKAASNSSIQYTKADSIKAMKIIDEAKRQPKGTNLVIYIARRLKAIPYVAKTLDKNKDERLVVNLRQLDCTTYVENVLAMYLCAKSKKPSFNAFCAYLRKIRYKKGQVSYVNRLHYFTSWIEENTRNGFVKETQSPVPPFTATQTVNINYMSKHPDKYPALIARPQLRPKIAEMEKAVSGSKYKYIPKGSIANNKLFRATIHNGDIIAIVTKKNGLDTSHIGLAVWHKDGLHLLNASLVRKRVVEEKMTLYTYMQKNKSQTGIRIIRIK